MCPIHHHPCHQHPAYNCLSPHIRYSCLVLLNIHPTPHTRPSHPTSSAWRFAITDNLHTFSPPSPTGTSTQSPTKSRRTPVRNIGIAALELHEYDQDQRNPDCPPNAGHQDLHLSIMSIVSAASAPRDADARMECRHVLVLIMSTFCCTRLCSSITLTLDWVCLS